MEAPPSTKRLRLSMACNQCRRRKVKCDAEYPKCRNCRMRNDECSTQDPRRPDVSVTREWIEGPLQQSPELNQQPPRGRSPPQPQRQSHASDDLANRDTSRNGHRPPVRPQRSTSITDISGKPGSTIDSFGISPVYQPHDMSFNLDHGTNRIKMMGASSSQTLTKSLDLYFKSVQVSPLSGHFIHGMRHAEEEIVPTSLAWPALPSLDKCEVYMTTFFNKIHVLYPVFDIDQTKNQVRQLVSTNKLQNLPPERIPILVSAYLIVSLGADEGAQKPTSDGDKYLQAAASLLSHVVLMPYLPSVQCLVLFTIAYRGRNKDGVGWQTIGMAIRVAQSLGLHRFSSVQPSSQHAIQLKNQQLFHARIWGICCCIEKTQQLESGRPSSIVEVDRDQMMGPEQHPPGHDFLQWHMGLAKFQGDISQHIYGHQQGTRSARQLLLNTAKLDSSLLDWANDIPIEFRPGSDLFCSNEYFHVAAHLSIQYYLATIALHRAALIAPSASFEAEVSEQCSDDPASFRLKKGESICVNSARSIARLTIELADRRIYSRILSVGPPLLACVVLGIYLMKKSSSRLQAADLELLKACADTVSELCLNCRMDPRFAEGPVAIYKQVWGYFDTMSPTKATAPRSKPSIPNEATTSSEPTHNAQRASRRSAPPSQHEVLRGDTQVGHSSQSWTQPLEMTPTYPQPFPGIGEPHDRPYGAIGASQEAIPPFDDSMPFTGLNVEDLWDWMLKLDSSDPSNDMTWLQPAG